MNIDGAGTFAIQAQAASSVSFQNVRATHISYSNPFYNCVGSSFQITGVMANEASELALLLRAGSLAAPQAIKSPSRANRFAYGPAIAVGTLVAVLV